MLSRLGTTLLPHRRGSGPSDNGGGKRHYSERYLRSKNKLLRLDLEYIKKDRRYDGCANGHAKTVAPNPNYVQSEKEFYSNLTDQFILQGGKIVVVDAASFGSNQLKLLSSKLGKNDHVFLICKFDQKDRLINLLWKFPDYSKKVSILCIIPFNDDGTQELNMNGPFHNKRKRITTALQRLINDVKKKNAKTRILNETIRKKNLVYKAIGEKTKRVKSEDPDPVEHTKLAADDRAIAGLSDFVRNAGAVLELVQSDKCSDAPGVKILFQGLNFKYLHFFNGANEMRSGFFKCE